MSSPDKELELIATTAAIYRPAQLHGKLNLFLNALLFQHECVLTELLENPEQEHRMALFHSFSQDTCALELMIKILHTIEPDFERGSEGSVQEVLRLSKERFADLTLDNQKQQLENLLNDN